MASVGFEHIKILSKYIHFYIASPISILIPKYTNSLKILFIKIFIINFHNYKILTKFTGIFIEIKYQNLI